MLRVLLFLIPMQLLPGASSWALTFSAPALAPEHDAVTLIRTDGHDPESGDVVPGYCNATLLSPLLLVTAAHCLADALSLGSRSIRVEVGRYKYVTRPDGQVIRVGYVPFLTAETQGTFLFTAALTQRIRSQGFSVRIGPEEDFAAVLLSAPLALPAGFPFAVAAGQKEFAQIQGSPLSYSPRVVTINPVEEVSTTDTKRTAGLNSVVWAGFFQSKSTSRVRPGDSGGPLFARVNGADRLVGVVKGEGKSFFSTWDAYAPLGGPSCDISRQLADPSQRPLLCHP
jgi:secreted trypsin-like serine protease